MSINNLLSLSVVILVLPLISFLIIIFNQKRLKRIAGWLGFSLIASTFIMSCIVAYNRIFVYGDMPMLQWKFAWFSLGDSSIQIGLGIDNLTAIMLIVVTLISSLVHLFSTEYMREDPRYPRFFAYLGLFSFSMLGIVLANNFLNMYIFWELVGISSYLLIGFWYEKKSAADANKKAFITNRIGDLGMLIGILICFFAFGTFMFDDIFGYIGQGELPFYSETILTIAGICLFCGAIGKSAQFPLHTWLPDAMEGPTPVSALIHAATMVAAGVYLTARIFPMLSADALVFVAYVGAITAFIAATIAITQNDFKRVLAYSTVSQLGYMIMGIGVGAMSLGFMHLVTHAWFKACLFLASGSVIHAMHHSMHHKGDHHTDPQDIRNMGGLRKRMPITYFTFLFACIAIAGVPLTSGFLSKDGILAGTLAFGSLSGHWFIPFAGFAAAFMTAFYMFRLCIVSFHGKPKTDIAEHTHENKWVITFPLVLLAALSFWFFYSGNPFNAGSGWFLNKIKTPESVVPAEYQFDFITSLDRYEYPTYLGDYRITHEITDTNGVTKFLSIYSNGEIIARYNSCGDEKSKRPPTKEEVDYLIAGNNKYSLFDADFKFAAGPNGKIIVDKRKYEHPDYTIMNENNSDKYGNIEWIHCSIRDGSVWAKEKNSKFVRTASMEEVRNSVADINKDGGYEGMKLVVLPNGKVIIDKSEKIYNKYAELTALTEPHALNKFEEESHHFHLQAMIMSLLIAGSGILLAFVVYQWRKINADKVASAINPLYKLSFNKWYIDEIYEKTFIGGTLVLSKLMSWFDMYVVDGVVNASAKLLNFSAFIVGKFDNIVVDGLVNFVAWTVGIFGILGRKIQTGSVQTYIAISLIGLMILIYFVA